MGDVVVPCADVNRLTALIDALETATDPPAVTALVSAEAMGLWTTDADFRVAATGMASSTRVCCRCGVGQSENNSRP